MLRIARKRQKILRKPWLRVALNLCEQSKPVALGLHHRLGPAGRAAPGGAALHAGGGGLAEEIDVAFAAIDGGLIGRGPLLGFENETAFAIGIDAAETGCAVAIVLEYSAFENIIVEGIIGATAVRRRHVDQRAKAIDEALRIGEFRPAGLAPMRDEVFHRQ